MSCGVGRRHGSDLALQWLWCRLVASALIRPLAWKLPYAAGAALKRQKENKQTNKQTKGIIPVLHKKFLYGKFFIFWTV